MTNKKRSVMYFLDTVPESSYTLKQVINETQRGRSKSDTFSESRRSVQVGKVTRRSAPERQMMNLTGSPDTATEDGRKASWVATREYTLVPMRDGSFLFFLISLRRTMPTVLLHCRQERFAHRRT